MIQIKGVLDMLPKDSDGQLVMEMYYINGLKVKNILEEVHISRSTYYDWMAEALDYLLEIPRVCAIISKYADDIEEGKEEFNNDYQNLKETKNERDKSKSDIH
jgi:predicted DNA-binding protein YlxM (UPF0122 family)